ncbi:MerR family transcriptional regulator [Lactococcus chungangensis CAU 28 = DSM 22330]|jgi:Predicted transcriptional regulators|uniref:DNA-binding transcriptional regulator, MerR family n=2 Tax=Pseudolactococcus chungangensis TaxID=451457 RepID=A0A1K2HI94_9LACT|nr:MerR family transcriptional regulator [Lactococcus chungangensis CAU 28 = DSM 22330]SFZ76495.1 DNA-binding transcriptional regulator, MerR family [Lactococcus chungangensis CAU 28 = DSM 22330]
MKTYKISEISKLTELSIPTLRYYEELGLLKPNRNSTNYRIFTDDDLRWIEFINRAKATGMTLSKIVDYSRLREKGDSTILDRINILAEQETTLQVELKKIQQHIDFLQNKKQYYTKLLDSPKKTSL